MISSITKKQLREFGILIGFCFPIIIGWILPIISGHIFRTWTLWIGIISISLGLLKPSLLFYPYKLWMKLGHVLGWINSRIILGVVFFVIVLPIAFIMRMFRYDPLRKKKGIINSYREDKINYKIDLKRIF